MVEAQMPDPDSPISSATGHALVNHVFMEIVTVHRVLPRSAPRGAAPVVEREDPSVSDRGRDQSEAPGESALARLENVVEFAVCPTSQHHELPRAPESRHRLALHT